MAYDRAAPILIALALALAAVVAMSYGVAQHFGSASSWRWIFIGLMIGLMVPFEAAATWFLRARRTLRPR